MGYIVVNIYAGGHWDNVVFVFVSIEKFEIPPPFPIFDSIFCIFFLNVG